MKEEYVPLAPPKEIKRCPIDNTFKIIGKKFSPHNSGHVDEGQDAL